jgi:HSP20 family protein
VDAEKVEVLLYEDAVVVTGERPLSPCAPEGVYHAAEIRHGPFRREVRLPCAVDAEAVAARYERGLLQITLPKLTDHGRIGR